jgi:hypothetical protein
VRSEIEVLTAMGMVLRNVGIPPYQYINITSQKTAASVYEM